MMLYIEGFVQHLRNQQKLPKKGTCKNHSLNQKSDQHYSENIMAKGPTPAMKQFYEMKERYPDTILFFQMGDFYETFGEDAQTVSEELGITLTARGKNKDGEKMPLAGVPIHAGESYMARMVKKGYRVAVCNQVEDPKKAKGVVKRDVVRVITPGTVIDSAMLGSEGPSYLMAVCPGKISVKGTGKKSDCIGLAFLDISTGEFFISTCSSDAEGVGLLSEISRYHPSECLVPEPCPPAILRILKSRDLLVTPYDASSFQYEPAEELLTGHLGVTSLDGFGCNGMEPGVAAAGACLSYALATQMTDLSHIRCLSTKHPDGSMVLDAITLRNLEILESIRPGGDESSLLSVLDRTKTAMGSRTMRRFLTAPLIEKAPIDERLDAVEYLTTHLELRTALRDHFRRIADVERIAGRISYGNAGPRDLVTLRESLERMPVLRDLLAVENLPGALANAELQLADTGALVSLIGRAVVDEPPILARTGGVIREGYDETLDSLRAMAHSGKDWIAAFQESERERTGIRSLKVGYNRIFGYYIEVTKTNLKLVPESYARKQTTANGERYTTPELQEKEALIAGAEERLTALEAELYIGLIAAMQEWVPILQEIGSAIGLLDVFTSLAERSVSSGYVRPVIEDSTRLLIADGRHPVVEEHLASGFVPNDADLDAGGDQILIITGANMAGKSTFMRQVALCCIMAQMGSFVPASHAVVGIVDRIFTRVGAFDDLASGQSTFMVEMLELANILNNATSRSLVILDEIGRGTSTLDGYAIAQAVLEFLHGTKKEGPRTLFATHFHELVDMEASLNRVKNYHFAVRDTGDDVVFLRKLIPGATDKSYGIHVASLAGIPKKVTSRAIGILDGGREDGAGPKIQRYTQMLLVDSPSADASSGALAKTIRELDVDTLSPREALAKLYELQDAVREGR